MGIVRALVNLTFLKTAILLLSKFYIILEYSKNFSGRGTIRRFFLFSKSTQDKWSFSCLYFQKFFGIELLVIIDLEC